MDNLRYIPNTKFLYKISPCGQVYSVRNNKFLSTRDNGNGYLVVHLCYGEGRKVRYIHRLVAETYLLNLEDKPQVNHIDGDKNNNHLSNLEWCTQSENMLHAFKNGLNCKKGEKSSKAKLTEIDVKFIRYWSSVGYKTGDLSRVFNISVPVISNIKAGRLWSHVT